MTATFVCNMPADHIQETLQEAGPLVADIMPPIQVEADPSWERIGDNLIGPPHAPREGKIHQGDVGIYYAPQHA
jgi:hypothetical protein